MTISGEEPSAATALWRAAATITRVSADSGLPTRSDIDGVAGHPAQLDDQLMQLVSAARSGNLMAMDTLLYAIVSQRLAEPGIRRVLVEPDDIDYVSQDVLIAVAEKVDSFRGESRFTTWLNGVARYKALEFVRRKQPETEIPSELSDTDRISSLVANQVSVQSLLAKLPENYRVAVKMRDIDGMAYADIATALDLNLSTVKTHIARGRALLASCAAAEALQ